ncbi:MAG: hypothetical protein EPO39_04520 [Candidatus Manganitrophaceae bacterium]|nr:MAG: hypothetical protein EPO39_04520 [Candidatus Manganitrophaceae bacterium]
MKFLIDRCAGSRLAEWLRQRGHDVVEARERGPDPGDRTLLEWAANEGRVLITIDQDFGEFIFSESARHAGLIRLPDVPAEKRIALIESILSSRSAEILEQSVVTVRGGRVRTSFPPPLKRNPPKK